MSETTDGSVLTNLNDLFEMEADRRVAEATARERALAEERARREREAAERERAIREVREAERQRAEEDRLARDAELDQRLTALRAQLEDVQREREQMRLRVAEAAGRSTPQRSGRAGILASVMAAAALIAALGAIYVSWPRAADVPIAPEPTPVAVVDEPAPVEQAPSEVEPPPVQEDEPAEVAAAEPPSRPRPHRPRPHRPRPVQDDLASQLDLGTGDDILGDGFLDSVDN